MSKMRVHELAKELGRTNREVITFLTDKGVEVKSHMSMLEEEQVSLVKKHIVPRQVKRVQPEERAAENPAQESTRPAPAKPAEPPKKKNITRIFRSQNSRTGIQKPAGMRTVDEQRHPGGKPAPGGARPAVPGVRPVPGGVRPAAPGGKPAAQETKPTQGAVRTAPQTEKQPIPAPASKTVENVTRPETLASKPAESTVRQEGPVSKPAEAAKTTAESVKTVQESKVVPEAKSAAEEKTAVERKTVEQVKTTVENKVETEGRTAASKQAAEAKTAGKEGQRSFTGRDNNRDN
ncbi:MAG: translation initiation factor IF-2 N-terminal domain-containing protein, partial [Eubacteriales bacterium]|nr:translation initiation factor IF-2 N-terminal domain-containing protein [Eubacteriales bacterium]